MSESYTDILARIETEARHQIGWEIGEEEAERHGYPSDRPGEVEPKEVIDLCHALWGALKLCESADSVAGFACGCVDSGDLRKVIEYALEENYDQRSE